ncbi:MAG: two-component system, OmpR family, sensor kinase, partial [Thermoleophilaceae bacterium]|nr:two-component system, OmpR family, sensor kinase [Thermoleophilaceae bacterium]
MLRRFRLSGLRVQLGIAIVAVTAMTLALAFVAVYRATSQNTRHRIDRELTGQVTEWRGFVHPDDLRSPAALEVAARRYLATQRYHPESLIFVVDVAGARTVTNHQAVVDSELAHEKNGEGLRSEKDERSGDGLLDAPTGLANVRAEQAGRLRVATYPIVRSGVRVGTLRVADPLESVDQAEAQLQRIFLVVGGLALALALVVATLMAVLIARPLRRITAVAADVDAGELSHRVGMEGHRGEIAVLGRSFDRMLDRLKHAFARQRQFVSDASHELRTPLAVMHSQVELLRDETDERARQEGLSTLLRNLDAMDRLVGDLLTLASADSSRLIEPRWIDLRLLLDDTVRDLPLFGTRDYRVEGTGGSLYADPDRLTQVLRNLVRNAVNHTTETDTI